MGRARESGQGVVKEWSGTMRGRKSERGTGEEGRRQAPGRVRVGERGGGRGEGGGGSVPGAGGGACGPSSITAIVSSWGGGACDNARGPGRSSR